MAEALSPERPIDAPIVDPSGGEAGAVGRRSRGGPRARLRRPVLAADRPAPARVRGLRRAAPPRHRHRADQAAQPARPRPLRRPGLRLRVRGAVAADRAARPRHPRARHLLRHAGDGPGARRPRRGRRAGRVRAHRALAGRRGRASDVRPAGDPAVLDEPPRLRLRAAARLQRSRLEPGLAGRRLRGHRARALRHPVPPRGRPHPAWAGDPRAVPARGCRLRGALVGGIGDRRADRPDPQAGRRRRRHLRPLRRRRLGHGRGARPRGCRRPAHLRARRPRPAPQGRGRAGRRDVP